MPIFELKTFVVITTASTASLDRWLGPLMQTHEVFILTNWQSFFRGSWSVWLHNDVTLKDRLGT